MQKCQKAAPGTGEILFCVFLLLQDINEHQNWEQGATGLPKQVMHSVTHGGNPAELSILMNMFTCGFVNITCT